MELRKYQSETVDAVYQYLNTRKGNPCAVIPTGGGKTPIMATLCKDVAGWDGRTLILANSKELLQQSADKLNTVCPEVSAGIYSAGLKRRDTDEAVIVGGIQSIYKKAAEIGKIDLILVDEAHLIPPDGEGMYRQFLKDMGIVNPRNRIVGLTATPYRMKSGMICGPGNILNDVCYEVGVKELIDQGYLCPLVSKRGKGHADTSGLHTRAGEFIASEVTDLMDTEELVKNAVKDVVSKTVDRNSVLVFAASVEHGQHIQDEFQNEYGFECGFVCDKTSDKERLRTLERFKQGDLKYLVNVNILTTGFDAPNIDCVVLLRPTLSPGLYYQMVGRGLRLFEGKVDCLILDYGENIKRHGPIDEIEPHSKRASGSGDREAVLKLCPECETYVPAGVRQCSECDYEFEIKATKHQPVASTESVISTVSLPEWYTVNAVTYSVHRKKGWQDGDPLTLKVNYRSGVGVYFNEWICIEHEGFAKTKAVNWWAKHSEEPVPETTPEAVEICERGGVIKPSQILIKKTPGSQWAEVIDHNLLEPLVELKRREILFDFKTEESEGPSEWAAGLFFNSKESKN